MKAITFVLILIAFILPLRADNWVENGDFEDGLDHWRGNGRSPADFAMDNPLASPDAFLSKGLILPLRHMDWDKVAQDFKGKSARGVLSITYMVSPSLTFSTKPEDYHNIPDLIHYDGWQPFNIPVGNWLVFIADFGSDHGTYYMIKPQLGSAKPQTYRARVMGLTPLEDKTITIAFPPGDGNVVLLNVSLTDQ